MLSRAVLLFLAATAQMMLAGQAMAGKQEQELRARLEVNFPPEMKIKSIKKTPVRDIYEIHVDNRVMYTNKEGTHVFVGSLIDLKKQLNLTKQSLKSIEEARKPATAKRLARVDEKSMLVIGSKKSPHTLTVFTDVDCGYCAKLHLEVPVLNKNGIRVRYLFYPRAGIGSQSYKKAVAVWCAKDRVKAIGDAKARKPIEMKECNNPIASHYSLGQELGLSGTPMLIMDDGTIISGYMPAPELIKAFKNKAG